jgi:antibiotic biosynthesis monooxygenase
MYTRVVELTRKSGKARELCNTIDDEVLPIPTRQAGFVDETVIVSDTEPNRVLALSFWRTRARMPNATSANNSTLCRGPYSTWKLRPSSGPLMSTPPPPTKSPQKGRLITNPHAHEGGPYVARPTLRTSRKEVPSSHTSSIDTFRRAPILKVSKPLLHGQASRVKKETQQIPPSSHQG